MSLHECDDKVLAPFEYYRKVKGKNIRGILIDCFQEWLLIPAEMLVIVKDIIDTLHNASLLIDDIEDSSKLRRGLPCAHMIYGTANTMNCANYVMFIALEKCHTLGSKEAMDVFVAEMLNLHRGQGQDILWREECRCPSEDQYKQMVLDKTGGLFRMAVGLMQAFAEDKQSQKDFTRLLNKLSLYFQIRDDYLNVASEEYMRTKSYCEDLTEGKFSFPIIHSITSFPDDSRLLNILRLRTEDIDVKKYAINWMEHTKSIEYTKKTLKELYSEVLSAIHDLGGHAKMTSLMQTLDDHTWEPIPIPL